jgi:hypothetical protein
MIMMPSLKAATVRMDLRMKFYVVVDIEAGERFIYHEPDLRYHRQLSIRGSPVHGQKTSSNPAEREPKNTSRSLVADERSPAACIRRVFLNSSVFMNRMNLDSFIQNVEVCLVGINGKERDHNSDVL